MIPLVESPVRVTQSESHWQDVSVNVGKRFPVLPVPLWAGVTDDSDS